MHFLLLNTLKFIDTFKYCHLTLKIKMLFSLFLLSISAQEIEPESNGLFSSIWKAVTAPVRVVSHIVYHKDESTTKLPISIRNVNVRQSTESFQLSSVDDAANRLSKYGFKKDDIVAKLKKAVLSKKFNVDFNNFAMDMDNNEKYKRYSQMQRIIVYGEKVNGATTLKVNYTGSNAEVEAKIVHKSTGKLFGFSTGTETQNIFRPLETSELDKIFNTLEYAINNPSNPVIYHTGYRFGSFHGARGSFGGGRSFGSRTSSSTSSTTGRSSGSSTRTFGSSSSSRTSAGTKTGGVFGGRR